MMKRSKRQRSSSMEMRYELVKYRSWLKFNRSNNNGETHMDKTPVLAVIGGSGLYNFPALENIETIYPDTPFGKPSAPIALGTLAGKPVAFLARHGVGHTLSPSEVPYR